MTTESIVVIGGGQAGAQVAFSLRQEGFEGSILIIAEEPVLPYQRPPLSKNYLAGEMPLERLFLRPAKAYEDQKIGLRLGCRVVKIDRAARRVHLDNGEELPYSGLAICTGTRVRPISVPGAGLDNIFYMRTTADADKLRDRLDGAKKAVIVGGGFIGLEAAAVLAKFGKDVTVVETMDRLMGRVVAPLISEWFLNLHQSHGVKVLLNAQVAGFTGDGGKVTGVQIAGGEVLAADLVVVGIGVIPNVEVATEAGLNVDSLGIVVDASARTSDPAIVAAGECTHHPNSFYQRGVRLESVQNAIDQAKTAAATLAGHDKPYHAVPWFWSDQYDVKLQMTGLSTGYDSHVLRGDRAEGKFSLLYYKGDRLLAVDSINDMRTHMGSKRLLAAKVSPAPEQAGDTAFDLGSLIPRPAAP
jgi:3-phenylpropionate/trans-cinnamate dioxygenase ferredoxin reductase subunit